MDKGITPREWQRYERHLALPEITPTSQKHLKQTHILMVGAGGLGAAALPYLAGAGIGYITIMDDDSVDPTNLHRQTIYKESETGQNKATLAADYLGNLNPHCEVTALTERATQEALLQNEELTKFDLILDGSDNFETKLLLNKMSVETKTPLISASVNRFEAMVGIFAGYLQDGACYNCLFPETPQNSCNCNEAGVLGTAAGLAGLYQAHLTLCYLLGIGEVTTGTVLSLNFETFRIQKLQLGKDTSCRTCSGQNSQDATERYETTKIQNEEVALLGRSDLEPDHLIIDVREPYEVEADPIRAALNIPLATLPLKLSDLPKDKMLALVCAANVRSYTGAQMLKEFGFDNVCVLDKARAA